VSKKRPGATGTLFVLAQQIVIANPDGETVSLDAAITAN
jgi:hypothetical protein